MGVKFSMPYKAHENQAQAVIPVQEVARIEKRGAGREAVGDEDPQGHGRRPWPP